MLFLLIPENVTGLFYVLDENHNVIDVKKVKLPQDYHQLIKEKGRDFVHEEYVFKRLLDTDLFKGMNLTAPEICTLMRSFHRVAKRTGWILTIDDAKRFMELKCVHNLDGKFNTNKLSYLLNSVCKDNGLIEMNTRNGHTVEFNEESVKNHAEFVRIDGEVFIW